jgi:hypothetical protein
MSCPSLEAAAAWVLGDTEAVDPSSTEGFEEHYFGCDVCLARVERIQRLVDMLHASLPTLLTAERRRDLAARHPGMPAIGVEPGGRATMRLGPDARVGIWLLRAPLARARRVTFEARNALGAKVLELSDAPFDAARGEVVLACQVHFRVMPAPQELHVRLTIDEPGGKRPVAEYVLDHQFES